LARLKHITIFKRKREGGDKMKWVEIIRLRSAGNYKGLLEGLSPEIANSDKKMGLVEMKIYRHASLETDLSLHLYWESEKPGQNGSSLGIRLVQAFKEFGLIDHSIWVEKEK
jgi:hypothetical protein